MFWLLLTALALAENPQGSVRYLTRDTASVRFADAETPGPALIAGDMVIVLFDDGARVRVKKGEGYGWVPADALAEAPPAPPVVEPPLPE